MTTELHALALARLDEWAALVETLRAGTWQVTTTVDDDYQFGIVRDHRVGPLGLNCRSSESHAQALVAAVNAFPGLIEVGRGVLTAHQAMPFMNSRGVHQCQRDGFDWPCADALRVYRLLGVTE